MQTILRLPDKIAEPMKSTAARLGMSANTYISQSIARCIALDVEKVALAERTHTDEVLRLSASANALIRIGERIDGASR